ncbi:MAG: hypothetical protein J6O51_11295 [Bacteroidales bacterium]|nr:hypothetical protein [Bacteroidales bacterium]
MEKFKRILAGLASILLVFALVGGIISAIVISIPVKAWPVWFGLPLLVFFAWKPAIYIIRRLADYAMDRQ